MEAIVKISGKQYRVAKGDRLTVDRLATQVGHKVTFDQVLLLTDGARATVGAPLVDGAAVTATVVAATRGPKLIVYKYKAKKRYRRTQGARAEQTLLEVVSISGAGAKPKSTKETDAPTSKSEVVTAEAETPKAKAAAEAPKGAPDVTKAAVEASAGTKTETTKTAASKRKTTTAKPKAAAPKAKSNKAGGHAAKPADKAKE